MAETKEPEIDEAFLEKLRRDPEVVVRKRAKRAPFKPAIRVVEQVDVLELLGRCDDENRNGRGR